jgi:hypothetical protein
MSMRFTNAAFFYIGILALWAIAGIVWLLLNLKEAASRWNSWDEDEL